jgi:hypothetical protein
VDNGSASVVSGEGAATSYAATGSQPGVVDIETRPESSSTIPPGTDLATPPQPSPALVGSTTLGGSTIVVAMDA